jgi:hypothetical protein
MTRVEPRLVIPLLSILAFSSTAAAQSAEAEMLFRDGRKLVKAGKIEEGCEKIEASEKIESSTGTLLNLGDCREKLGEYATAWAAFRKAEATAKRAGDGKRRNEASKRAMQLEPKLSYLAIVVPSKIDGLVIKRDNEVIDPVLWNSPIPVDPDEIKIVAEAPGYKPWRTQITFNNAKPRRQTVTVPALERLPVARTERPRDELAPTDLPPVAVTGAPPPGPLVVERPTTTSPSMWTTQRKVAVVLGLGGAVAIGTGVYFGLRSNDLESTSNEICPMATCDDPEGLRLNDRAQTAARNANIGYGVGGALLATGVVLWFVGGPHEMRVQPTVSSDQAGVSLKGKF